MNELIGEQQSAQLGEKKSRAVSDVEMEAAAKAQSLGNLPRFNKARSTPFKSTSLNPTGCYLKLLF